MKSLIMLMVVRFFAFSPALAQTEKLPDKAVCVVCAALEGKNVKPEKVKASAQHEGATYYFCSADCKSEFDDDPLAYSPPVLPRAAPKILVEDLTGKEVSLDDFRGRVVLVDFWATWCKPCAKMMPELQKLSSQYAEQGFTVIGISIDAGSEVASKVKKFIENLKVTYPILLDVKPEPAWQAFHVRVIPATFLIDRNGQIVQQWRGEVEIDEIKSAVARLVGQSK